MSYPPTQDAELFATAQRGDTSGVASLLRGGARPTAIDAATGWSALAAALVGGHARVAEALLEAGADVRAVDRRGNSVLHACAAGASATDGDEVAIAVARRILTADPSAEAVGAPNHEGVTPAHLAAQRGKCDLLTLLAEFGAPLSAKDRAGRDPYHYRCDATTERVLLRLISEAALKSETAAASQPGARVGNLPWNVPAPAEKLGPKAQPRLPGSGAAAKVAASAKLAPSAGGLKPPPKAAAPPPPAAQSGESKTSGRAAPAKTMASARRGRPLTAQEERNASYLSAYLARDVKEPAVAQPSKPGKKGDARAYAADAPAGVAPADMTVEQKLRRAFRMADTDGSKAVGKRELYKALEKVGVSAFSTPEGLKLFQEADTDGDGQLTFDEFAQLARRLRPLLEDSSAAKAAGAPPKREQGLSMKTRQQLRRAFAAFDADGSGWISISELSGALRRCGMYVGDEQLRKMFDEADLDRSGGIDVEEFETLVERLMAPSRLIGAASANQIPSPSAGSATTMVFAAFAQGSTGFMLTRELPSALRLLGLDPEEPLAAKAIEQVTATSRGAMGRHAFGVFVHRLLKRDFSFDADTAAGSVDAPDSSRPTSTKVSPAGAGPQESRIVDEPDPRKRLAQLFVLCDSQEDGSIAARDVPELLWRARVLTDSALLPALAPKPEHASARVPFERLLSIAFGERAVDVPVDLPPKDMPPLQLFVQDLVLAPWVLTHDAVNAVNVVVRAGLRSVVASASKPSTELVPVVLRTATFRKQSGTMKLDLDVMLPAGTTFVHFELMHEIVRGSSSVLARGELDLNQLYEGVSYPLPYTLPLFDARAVQAGTLQLVATRSADLGPPTPAIASARKVNLEHMAFAPSATEVAALEAEVSSLRVHASELQRQRDAVSVQLRAEQRLRGGMPGVGIAALSGAKKAASGMEQAASRPPQDWRFASASALERALGHLKRRNRAHGDTTHDVAAVLARSQSELLASATREVRSEARQPPAAIV